MSRVVIESEPDRLVGFVDGNRIGWMDYEVRDGVARLYHTEVPAALRGSGTGTLLVVACLEWFRDNTAFRIAPLCPFIPAVMRRHPEFHSLTTR